MIDKNKAPNQKVDLLSKSKICNVCNEKIKEENLIRNTTYMGYRNLCKPCRNKRNLEYARKRQAIIKNNPLW